MQYRSILDCELQLPVRGIVQCTACFRSINFRNTAFFTSAVEHLQKSEKNYLQNARKYCFAGSFFLRLYGLVFDLETIVVSQIMI